LLISLVLFVGCLLGRKKTKNAKRLKRYHTMPVNRNIEENTELETSPEQFYCIYGGEGKSCVSGFMPKESKE